MEDNFVPTKRKQSASIELVVLGLLAALIAVLAMPLLSQATSVPAHAAILSGEEQ